MALVKCAGREWETEPQNAEQVKNQLEDLKDKPAKVEFEQLDYHEEGCWWVSLREHWKGYQVTWYAEKGLDIEGADFHQSREVAQADFDAQVCVMQGYFESKRA